MTLGVNSIMKRSWHDPPSGRNLCGLWLPAVKKGSGRPSVKKIAWPRPAIPHQLVGSEPPSPPDGIAFVPIPDECRTHCISFSVLRCIGGTDASVPGCPLGAQPLFAQKILLLLRGLANRWLMKGEPWTIAADDINDGDGHATTYMRMVRSQVEVNQCDEYKMHTS